MVKVEEYCQEDCKWNCNEYIGNFNIPEMNKPSSILSREKGSACWKRLEADTPHAADVNEPSEKNNRQGGSVIFDELSNVPFEQRTGSKDTAEVAHHQNKECDHYRKVR